MGFLLHLFLCLRTLRAADGFHLFHAPLHRRFREESAFLELFQDARPLVLLLETL